MPVCRKNFESKMHYQKDNASIVEYKTKLLLSMRDQNKWGIRGARSPPTFRIVKEIVYDFQDLTMFSNNFRIPFEIMKS